MAKYSPTGSTIDGEKATMASHSEERLRARIKHTLTQSGRHVSNPVLIGVQNEVLRLILDVGESQSDPESKRVAVYEKGAERIREVLRKGNGKTAP